jgi:hypothetical protein
MDDTGCRRRGFARKARVRMLCNWDTLDFKNNAPCLLQAYRSGYCQSHFKSVFRASSTKTCIISTCDTLQDKFGDRMCTVHSIENDRPTCITCNVRDIWMKTSEYCKECDTNRKCCVVGCKRSAPKTSSDDLRHYCAVHLPSKRECRHIHTTKCRNVWHSSKVNNPIQLCWLHNGPEKISRRNRERNRFRSSGLCSYITTSSTKCHTPVGKDTEYCSAHKPI